MRQCQTGTLANAIAALTSKSFKQIYRDGEACDRFQLNRHGLRINRVDEIHGCAQQLGTVLLTALKF